MTDSSGVNFVLLNGYNVAINSSAKTLASDLLEPFLSEARKSNSSGIGITSIAMHPLASGL